MSIECYPKPELGYVLCIEDGIEEKHYYVDGAGGHEPPPSATKQSLGDYTEALLDSIGINQTRYKLIKEKWGFAPTCNCDKRKAWLNKVSNWLTDKN